MKENIKFTHLVEGKSKDVAIAHIYKTSNPSEIHEYAVVRYPNTEEGNWSHALAYYTVGLGYTQQGAYEQAVTHLQNYLAK